mmetsp:Transcript_5303/g.17653  ORF Transcript_5303/g.17653 Transcript_5303/m.17653 type:complete len:176 (-) Transcript_5303:252-779(-)
MRSCSSVVLLLSLIPAVSALATPQPPASSRRAVLVSGMATAALGVQHPLAARAAVDEQALLAEIKAVRSALDPLPALLDEEKWDAVRSVLKVPPVGNLWNLGESKNSIRKLADLRDDVELFELADEVAGALQLADQYTYDNVFIPFQPGNGKVKIKEPKQQVKIAKQKLDEVLSS